MAISHLCLSCGLDLARQRARRDPIHHLPIVTCPECGRTAVRRRHPLITQWRRWRHVEVAVSVLFLQLLVAMMLVLVIVNISHTAAEQMALNHQSLRTTLAWALLINPPPSRFALNDFGPVDVDIWIGVSMLAGIWLGSCFPHWRWWTLCLAWAALLIAAMNTDMIAWALIKPSAMLADIPAPYTGPSLAPWSVLLSMVGASTLTTLACFPLGVLVRRAYRNALTRRWKKRLANARRARRQS